MAGEPITVYMSVADRDYVDLIKSIAAFYKAQGSDITASSLMRDAIKKRADEEVEKIQGKYKIDLKKYFFEWKNNRGLSLHEFFSKKTRGGTEYNRKLDEYFVELGKRFKE